MYAFTRGVNYHHCDLIHPFKSKLCHFDLLSRVYDSTSRPTVLVVGWAKSAMYSFLAVRCRTCRVSLGRRGQLVHDRHRDEGHVQGGRGRSEAGLLSSGDHLPPGQAADMHRLSHGHRPRSPALPDSHVSASREAARRPRLHRAATSRAGMHALSRTC